MENKSFVQERTLYEDLYDLHTIEECIRMGSRSTKTPDSTAKRHKITKEKAKVLKKGVTDLILYFYKGDRYSKRTKLIDQWMDKDQNKQDFYDNSTEPSSIYCESCGDPMFVIHKILEDYTNQEMQVMYMFECPECKKRDCFYEDGTKKHFEPDLCNECSHEIKRIYKDKGDVHITISKCTSCNFEEKREINSQKEKELRIKEEKSKKLLLRKYRSRYCLSEKEGSEFICDAENLKSLYAMMDKQDKQSVDPVYKAMKEIKKLSFVELEKLITEVAKEAKFIKLQFDKPEIEKYVIIPFSLQDADSKRPETHSVYDLQKLIRKALKKTNWRLMSEGITYRLGYLSGRLKGYETEDDLYKLAKQLKN